MKRILIFSLAYYPSHVSGAEIAIREITDRISPQEIAFDMITLRFDKRLPMVETIGNVRIYRVPGPKALFPFLAALGARRLHAKNHYDALWAMMTYMLLPVVLARMLGLKLPYILTLQDGDPYEKVFSRLKIKPFLPLINYGFRHAHAIQAISHYLSQWPALRGSNVPVEVIPNGASAESALTFPEDELHGLAQKIGKKEGDVCLLSIGRLVHQKGIDTVIRSLQLLPGNIRLIVVGQGPDRAALEALAREIKVESRVYFAGQVNRSETARFRKISSAFVLPSRSEGQGISFLSTMLSGLPIVATQEGGIADFLFDAKRNPEKPTTGWAVDADNPEQIAEAVQDILTHSDVAQKVALNAQALAREKYDWDTLVPQLKKRVFEKVLQK
jgi:glycosyltransferase involved in cell wall biosynthesis